LIGRGGLKGRQYCSGMFPDAFSSYGMRSSMSRKGDCRDNAPTESLWGSLKVGRLYGRRFATQREAMDEVIDWLTFYNHRRPHSTLGSISPMKFDDNWRACQARKAAWTSGYALRLTGARSLVNFAKPATQRHTTVVSERLPRERSSVRP